MSNGAASEGKLGALHDALADNLIARLENGEEVFDSKSGEFVHYSGGTTATLSVIVRFLADNDITCVATEANKVGKLQERLNAARKAKHGAKVVNLADHVPKAGGE